MNVNKVLKRIFAVALMIFVMLCSTCFVMADSYDGPSPHGETAIINVKDKIANIRRGAGTNYELVGSLLNGSRVEVYGSILNSKKEKWHYIISSPNGRGYAQDNAIEGWTHDSNLDFDIDDRKIEYIRFSRIQDSEYSNKKVAFGKYIQNDPKHKKEDTIYWRVLDDRHGKFTLVCENVIEATKCKSVEDIRKFLDEEFAKKAFTEKEREKVIVITAPDDYFYTQSSIVKYSFRLSSINTYPTVYVLNKIDKKNKYSPFIKCIHSIDTINSKAVIIEDEYGNLVKDEVKLGNEYYGIRPIIRVKKEDVKLVEDNE